MKRKIAVRRGGKNIFEDLKLPDAEELNAKTRMANRIGGILAERNPAIPKQHNPAIEVPSLYRAAARRCGVFVNMALTEPFGLTLLEAAASGLPVVATSDGGPSEIIPTLKNGILADPLNIPAIQAAIRSLLTDEKRWLDCSLSGIRKVRQHYNWENHVERYLQLIRSIKSRPMLEAA